MAQAYESGPSKDIQDFYTRQSVFTDPLGKVSLYRDLPSDPRKLAGVVQGLLIPPYSNVIKWYSVDPNEIDCDDVFGIRRMEQFLERIQVKDSSPLSDARPPQKRLGMICRNFAILHVSMLRNAGIPARERVGFAGYLDDPKGVWWEHRITQFWSEREGRWMLADSMIDELQRKQRGIKFDTFDIRRENCYLVAADVWLGCRSGRLDPMKFGDSETDLGMPPIKYALLHDFAALNKFEILGNDDWGELIKKRNSDLTEEEYQFLDKIATATSDPDLHFQELRQLFKESSYGKEVSAHSI